MPSLAVSLVIIFLLHLMEPTRLTQTNRHVRHDRPLCSPVPMHLSRRDVHDVADLQLLRLLPLGTDQAGSDGDGQDLAALVAVPEGARAGREAHVVGHAVVRFEYGVHVHGPREGFGRLPRGAGGEVGGAD